MRKITGKVANIIAAAMMAASLAALVVLARPASGQDAGGQATYRDIEQTLGIVPTFFKLFPESGIAGAWAEFKSVQLNPKTKLDGKTKELIGLAVAAQIPCHYCVYFHTSVARANGASDEEIREAVAMAAISRHWSTVLNGMQVDFETFKKETDTVLKLASDKARTSGKAQ
ncbi:MAG TPA: carboxymuconolactone decarboxylase family protein [Bradyrhizobium sp.]